MENVNFEKFTNEALEKENKDLNEIDYEQYKKFEYTRLLYYFQRSKFYLFLAGQEDLQVNQQIEQIRQQFQQIENPDSILFFYFIRDKNEMEIYLALYSNTIGIIYDLVLGLDYLDTIFNSVFPNTCLVSLHKEDKKSLSYLVDLSSSYFLNSFYITSVYDNKSLDKVVKDNILKKIDPKYTKDAVFFQIMIRLIVYYVPLIAISTDNLHFSPLNIKEKTLPKLKIKDFIEIAFLNGNSFQTSNLYLHKESFEFYAIDTMKYEISHKKFFIQKDFYQKIYDRCEDSFAIPCYGTFEHQQNSGYEMQNGFLFKFICNGKISYKKKNNYIVKNWDDTTKSLNMYRLLISILFLHEFGFFHRNIKPDHVFLDNENKAYFGGFATICELNNTNNELIGSDTCQSPEQYKQNISTPYSDIYSYGVNVYYFITGKIGDRTGNFFVEDEKMKKLLKECLYYRPQFRPDSLVLFTQMHELNLFLPKTNKTLIDNLFNSTYESLLRTNFVNGKYLSMWSNALEKSEYKNIILQYLPSTFIYKFALTELEINLNQALNDNIFLIDYNKNDIFQINFFAEELQNKELKKKTDEIIELIPKPYQIISKLIFYYNFLDLEYENLNKKYENEINEFVKNFDDCILLSSSFSIDPQFILESIINKKDLELTNSHNTILYVLQIADSFPSKEVIIDILHHFTEFSDDDIRNLDLTFQTEDFSKQFKRASSNVPDLEKDIIELKKMELELDKIMGDFDKEEDISSSLKENSDLFDMIEKIEEEQKYIKLLESSLGIK